MTTLNHQAHLERARKLRHEMTPAEIALWHHLRRNQHDFHFRRQPPICGFYPDFACVQLRLVVEVDGGVHESRIDYDAERTAILESHRYSVIRFPNEEVLKDPGHCAAGIRGVCYERARAMAGQNQVVRRRLNQLYSDFEANRDTAVLLRE